MASGREKRMIKTPGANMGGKVNSELLRDCQLLYLSGDNIPLFVEYVRLANEIGIRVFCGGRTAEEEVLLGNSSGAVLNHDELRHLTGLEEPEEGLPALDLEVAAVTLPTGGCIVSHGVEIEVVEAPEIEPVDRTGGGDAFAAGFLAGIASGRSVRESGVMGNLMAAEVIVYPGTRPDIILPDSLHKTD
jgi:ribokinase